jgi:predicted phosphodiesterase
MDPNRPFRTELIRDARARVKTLGPVAAILVAGDIAYRGIAEEYAAAFEWLTELAEAAGCALTDVFVVPGNHDVDQAVIKSEVSVRNAQLAIASATANRERALLEQFHDSQAGHSLFAPIAAYNTFAANFDCQVFPKTRLAWQQERPIADGIKLRFHGLTSTLLSGSGAAVGQVDTKGKLYLSPMQTVLDVPDGVVNVVLCHHPPDWFSDHEAIEDAICGRASVHFFGHKHRQRISQDTSHVRFAAGAVNPDRHEPDWRPGYNLVNLNIAEDGGMLFLDINARLLEWQTNPDGFQTRRNEDSGDNFHHRIKLRVARKAVEGLRAGPAVAEPVEPPTPTAVVSESVVADEQGTMTEAITRAFILDFWSITSSQRREITQRHDLVAEGEISLPEPERYARALQRASEQGLLRQLVNEVRQMKEGTK